MYPILWWWAYALTNGERNMNEDLWESLFDRIENELKTGDIHTLYLLLDCGETLYAYGQ